MTQHWRRSADGHIDAGDLDASPQGPGTESNRARAARGVHGPDVFSVYLDGQRIAGAPMDRVAVGVDHASGPDFTGRSVVAIGLDGERIAVPVDPNAMAAQTAQAVATAMGSRWEAEGNVVRPREQPTPAPGQVWALPSAVTWTDADGTLTLTRVHDGRVYFKDDGFGVDVSLMDRDGWTCIGVATPRGRVMVGDGWRGLFGYECEVVGVFDAQGCVLVRWADGVMSRVPAVGLLAAGWTCTRYAPARAGERYRSRVNNQVFTVTKAGPNAILDAADGSRRMFSGMAHIAGWAADPAQWERLDAARSAPTAYKRAAAEEAPPSYDVTIDHPRCRSVTVPPAMREAATLTLQAPARDLRALADAISRALESTEPHYAPFAGHVIRVQRDELLFSPTYSTGTGAALAGDTRALAALRRCLLDAMATGCATLPAWGAKGPRVEVRREGPPMVAHAAAEPSEAPRYQASEAGANGWRWEVGA